MNVFDDEILNLWKSFHKYEVRYILVGGFAVNFHKYWRATNDIDLFVDDTLENRKKSDRYLMKSVLEILSP